MSEQSAASPEWLESLAACYPTDSIRIQRSEDPAAPHGIRLSFHAVNGVPGGGNSLSFALVPSGESIAIELTSPSNWVLTDLMPGAEVIVIRSDSGSSSVTLADSVEGRVTMHRAIGNDPAIVNTSPDCAGTLTIASGEHTIDEVAATVRVRLEGGAIAASTLHEAYLCGDVQFGSRYRAQARMSIERLVVQGRHSIGVLSGVGQAADIETVVGGGRDTTTLTTKHVDDQQGGQPGAVVIRAMERIRFDAPGDLPQEYLRRAEQVAFGCRTQVGFAPSAKAADVVFEHDAQTPVLGAGRGAVLSSLAGVVTLKSVAEAHLEGNPRTGFKIESISGPNDGQLQGSFLRDFTVPPGLEGRRILGYFDAAHVVEPLTRDLPGSAYTILGPMWNNWGNPPSEIAHAADTRQEAELLRQLHELTRTRGSTGAVRTRVGWLAQRLRHVTTRGRVERSALAVYRLLGYGERAIPALLTWLAVAALIAVGQVVFSKDTMLDLLRDWAQQAASPVSTVLGGGATPLPHPWMAYTRAFVAIPLVVGVLSLRHYVKSS